MARARSRWCDSTCRKVTFGTIQSVFKVPCFGIRIRHIVLGKKEATHEPRLNARGAWYIPKFERTRIVTLMNREDQVYATCSCNYPTHNAMCCRHIYAIILKRWPVKILDADLRWWLVYAHYYNVDSEMTAQLDSSIHDSYHSGVPLLAADIKGRSMLKL